MESRSKFACLYIDDDSDEDFIGTGGKLASKKSSTNGSTLNGAKHAKSSGKLLVHAVEKRPKAKKANKEKVIDAATGLIVQETDHHPCEQKCREGDHEHHLPATGGTLHPVDEESQCHDSPSFTNCEEDVSSEVIEWYKKKLADAIEQMVAAKENAQSAQDELEKYKARYRKLVELFRDVEVTEKAKLVIELDKARTSEAELASQLVVTQTELEKHKSKLRTLGALK